MKIAEIVRAIPSRKRNDAIWLLSALLFCSKAELFFREKDELSPEELKIWRKWWKRAERGEPLQYIAGEAPFYGREFLVDKRVLIPRPETEQLVQLALDLLTSIPKAKVLDIGTGSGAIALTLKAERLDFEITGSDFSASALSVAKKNAVELHLDVAFEKHDLFSPKLRRQNWDLVVSNPPYLQFGKDFIAQNVKDWEPKMALEPAAAKKVAGLNERAAWCAERILQACAENKPRFTALELSPRIATLLEKRWRKNPAVQRIWREPDLTGRKRFLLLAWHHG